VDTAAEEDVASTRYVAYDPWQMLYKRPVRDAAGVLPPADGQVRTGETARDILVDLLTASETYDGPTYIDYTNGLELNQTAVISEITFQQGMTIGEAMDELVDTGTIDIVLKPVFDVFASPVVISQLETYVLAGAFSPDVIMAWDQPGRTLVGLGNMREGQGRENEIRYHYGQGGTAVGTITDAASQTRFGTYFAEKFFPGQTSQAAVELLADKILLNASTGRRTLVADPSPERGKQPFVDYNPGDRVIVNASANFLEQLDTEQRIMAIPIAITDDGIEAVNGLVFTDEGWVGS
jgi:hypothetical protein